MTKPYSIARFKAAWVSDMKAKAIAVEFGVTTRTVGQRAKALGLPSRKGTSRALKIPLPVQERMIDMRRFGMGIREIGKACGVSGSVTQRMFEASGMPRMPRGRIPATLTDYHQHRLAIAMTASASKTRKIEGVISKWDSAMFPGKGPSRYAEAMA